LYILLFYRHFFSTVDWFNSHEDVIANNVVLFNIICKYKIRLTAFIRYYSISCRPWNNPFDVKKSKISGI